MYGLHSSVVTSPLLKKKTCQERSAPMLGFVFPIRGVRREREREYMGANVQASPPPAPWVPGL
jgi:hypothetical protein